MATGTYRCSACENEWEMTFKAGHPPTGSECEKCRMGTLEWVPEPGGGTISDELLEGTQRSAWIQLCRNGERPPTTKQELKALERREKVDIKRVAGGKRWV